MAYFSNGSEGDYYTERYCDRCVHGQADELCPVMLLHMDWNYEAVGTAADKTKATALNTLWPRQDVHNGDCLMFVEARGDANAIIATAQRLLGQTDAKRIRRIP